MSSFGNNASGFTVIEILVAIFLGSLVLGTLYGAYSMVVNTTENYSRVSDVYQTGRIVLDTVSREISGAFQPLAAEDEIMFLGEDEWYRGSESDRLSLVSTTLIRGDETYTGYDNFEIIYYRGAGEKDGLLYTQTTPFYDLEEPFSERIVRLTGGEIMAENIRALDFKYFDGLEWYDEWIPAAEEEADGPVGLPRAVRITLAVGLPGEEDPARFTTVAYLPMTPLEDEEEAIE